MQTLISMFDYLGPHTLINTRHITIFWISSKPSFIMAFTAIDILGLPFNYDVMSKWKTYEFQHFRYTRFATDMILMSDVAPMKISWRFSTTFFANWWIELNQILPFYNLFQLQKRCGQKQQHGKETVVPTSSSQTPPSVTIIIKTPTICHHHHNHHHLSPSSSQPPP